MFTSRIERQIEAAHHNGPPGNKCEFNHGHSWTVIVTFEYDDMSLDAYGWGPPFGLVKEIIDQFDHKDLNEMLDGRKPSAENFSKYLYYEIMGKTGVRPASVQLFEGKGNSVTFTAP